MDNFEHQRKMTMKEWNSVKMFWKKQISRKGIECMVETMFYSFKVNNSKEQSKCDQHRCVLNAIQSENETVKQMQESSITPKFPPKSSVFISSNFIFQIYRNR